MINIKDEINNMTKQFSESWSNNSTFDCYYVSDTIVFSYMRLFECIRITCHIRRNDKTYRNTVYIPNMLITKPIKVFEQALNYCMYNTDYDVL